jgi:hypothetical protein
MDSIGIINQHPAKLCFQSIYVRSESTVLGRVVGEADAPSQE